MKSYEAVYRNTAMALPVIISLIFFVIGSVALGLSYAPDGDAAAAIILPALGIALAGVILVLLTVYRQHRWEITPEGVSISERPKVPLMGATRKALVPYAQIAGLKRVESGLDLIIEIVDAAHVRYLMPQIVAAGSPRVEDFLLAIRAAAGEAGVTLGDAAEGLSFWNRPAGLAFLGAAFVVSLFFTGAAMIAFFDGGIGVRARGGETMAIVAILPFGVAWVIWKSLRRRRAVLSGKSLPR